jgi:hypothetical protein
MDTNEICPCITSTGSCPHTGTNGGNSTAANYGFANSNSRPVPFTNDRVGPSPTPPVLVLEKGQAEIVANPLAPRNKHFEELLDRLEDTENLRRNFFSIVDTNHHIYRMIRSYTVSWRYSQMRDEDALCREQLLLAPFAVLIAVIMRLFNKFIYVFVPVVISLLLLQAGATGPIFSILSFLRIAYDKRFTIRVAEALGMRRRREWPAGSSKKIAIMTGDNCHYRLPSYYEHAEEEKQVSYYNTINWFIMPLTDIYDQAIENGNGFSTCVILVLPNSLIFLLILPIDPSALTVQDGTEARTMTRILESQADHESHRTSIWGLYMGILFNSSARSALGHPNGHNPGGPSRIIWMPHIPDVGTAAYGDVQKFLNTAIDEMRARGLEHVFACGDQQTFIRIVFSKRFSPVQYSMITPCPGEWHFCVHVLMAIHLLHWKPFLSWFNTRGFCQKTVIYKWDSVVRYDDYKFFHEAIIAGCLEYLKQVVPRAVLENIGAFKQNCSRNKGKHGCFITKETLMEFRQKYYLILNS